MNDYKIKISPYANIFYTEWLLNPTDSSYNLSIDQILHGSIDIERLRVAIKRYVSEHVVLNSHIKIIDEKPHWMKNEYVNELEYSENISDLLSYVSNSFDLHKGPLYRFKLLRISDATYRFIAVFHHIVIDGGISINSGIEAISKYYNNQSYTSEHSIAHQIELLSNFAHTSWNLSQNTKYKEFWHQQLSDIESIDLSFLKTNDKQKTGNPIAEINFSFGSTELAKLIRLGSKYGITPYIYSQCIFALLLYKYTNHNRLAISCPISIREGVDFIYGAQVNTNIIPYQLIQTTTISELFHQALSFFKLMVHGDVKYGYYPITNIIHDGCSKQLLNVSFTQAFLSEHPLNFEGITKTEMLTELNTYGVSEDTLLFEYNPRDRELNYRVRYNKHIINEELINNFIFSYKKLFLEVLNDLAQGNKSISQYSLLSQDQYNKIVLEWNRTEREYPNKTIHQIFEEQVLKNPNNIAVVYEDAKLTYNQLNTKANQLANYLLQTYAIKPDDLVALCLDRNEYMLIAILGVLKAGGAYVPINPNHPNDRIEYILSNIKTKVVLTNSEHTSKIKQIIERATEKKKIDILVIDNKEMQLNLSYQENTNPVTTNINTNLAYVIYTSGTTGNPKGVLIEHHSVVNYTLYLVDNNKLGSKSIGSQYSDFSFDALVIEIYPILLSGGALYIVPELDKLDIIKISDFLNRNKITYSFLPTKFAELFSRVKNTSLVNLIIGGEKLDRIVNQTYRIINAYGPTEATVQSTSFTIDKSCNNAPIGKPISNVKCYIVDNNLNPLPIGAIGELIIGGENLARGYLGLPELTAEKFIPNHFQTPEEKFHHKNSRLYKTGDLARLLPDGNIEYLGRNDFQVKIRGYRIELGEIENKLLTYPLVKQAVVLAKERSNADNIDITTKYLLAYYVSDKKLNEEKIQSYLATQLPDYMLPQALVYMSNLPLTSNGKVDKKALPEPELKLEYTAPRNDLEKNICEIYAKVLNLPTEQIGITNDFFKMGGDSILSIQLVAIIRQKLSLNINIKDIFNYKSVDQLVKNILSNQKIQQENTLDIKREDNPIGKSDFLPIQEWFFNNIKNGSYKKHNHWNQSFVIKTPELDIGVLKLSVKKLLQYHDAFRLRYKDFEQSYIEIDLAAESENIKIINISNLSDIEIKNKLIEIQSNFNIETGPIYAIAYLHGYKDKTARLFFAIHHLIVDSVSWRIITHDIAKLYELLQDQKNTTKTSQDLLGHKGTSYRQWASEIKNYKPSQQELNYWNHVLKNYTCISKSIKKSYDEFLLTQQLTQDLLTRTNEAYNTQVNDVLLSALTRTLTQTFNRQINYVTLEGHGREEINLQIDITKTMGWFTTMYPVKLVNQPVIADLIKTTKNNLKNIPNKGIGYGPIKGYKNLPNISFNYLGQIGGAENFWTIVDHIISIDPQNQNSNILDIYGYVVNNILKFHVSCNDDLLDAKLFADKFKSNLEELINHCSNTKCCGTNEHTQDKEMHTFLDQIKSYYAKANKNQTDEQLQNKIDYYLKNVSVLPQDLFLQKPITNVLLTGSTGFLGCNLLNELLKSTNYNIFLLIRADSQISAVDRINKKFQFYFDKTLDGYEKRISVLKSDLVVNNLGLSENEYKDLSIKIDSIIHSAALIKLYGDYDNFYLQNVQSTTNLLEFAKLTKLKDFHYISTRSVLDSSCGSMCTEDDMSTGAEQDNAYLGTKLQAERQTIKYRAYGIKSSIYRVGNLAFISENYRTQENIEDSGFLNWVKCLFKLKCVAKEISDIEISPADLTAKAIVKLFDKNSLSNKTHHVFNPCLFNMSENSEHKIKQLSIDKFIDRIIDELKLDIYNNLIMRFLSYQGWVDDSCIKNMRAVQVLQDRTQHILKHLGFEWTQTTIKTFLNRYYKLLNINTE